MGNLPSPNLVAPSGPRPPAVARAGVAVGDRNQEERGKGAVGPSLGDRRRHGDGPMGCSDAGAGDRVPVLLAPAKRHFEEKI